MKFHDKFHAENRKTFDEFHYSIQNDTNEHECHCILIANRLIVECMQDGRIALLPERGFLFAWDR
jgi:hypothetical protein